MNVKSQKIYVFFLAVLTSFAVVVGYRMGVQDARTEFKYPESSPPLFHSKFNDVDKLFNQDDSLLRKPLNILTKDDFIAYGMKPNPDEHDPDRFVKTLAPGTEDGSLGPIILTMNIYANPGEYFGKRQFCLILPEEQRIFLQPANLGELDIFLKTIERYEPVW